MANNSERDVLLVGQSSPIQELLTQAVTQCGASAKSFAAWEGCANALHNRSCRLLVIDADGDATSAFQMLAESRQRLSQTPVLVLIERGDIATAIRAIRAGASDCLEKPAEMEKLRATVDDLLRPGAPACPDLGAVLTKTECLVLTHVLEGRTNREIADLLHRSPRTIEVHRRRIMHKLGASNVVHLVRQAATMGFIGPR
jgi:two-component system response regulator FixJ